MNTTRQQPIYPRGLFEAARYLRRRIEEHQDELVMNADTLNVVLVELERIEAVLGSRTGITPNAPLAFLQLFGDGSDGNVIIDGNITLARDMYYRNLTLRSGILNTNGYRIFVREFLRFEGGRIAADGSPGEDGGGSSASGGFGAPSNVLGGGADGGDSETNGNNNDRRGGDGGDGTDADNPGGSGGTTPAPSSDEYGLGDIIALTEAINNPPPLVELIQGGAGGGGGGPLGAIFGGGGGGGGGVVMVAAQMTELEYETGDPTQDLISANGGSGGAGGGAGSGGGGGGGVVIFATHKTLNRHPSGVDIPLDWIVQARGGTSSGNAGSDGETYDVRL